MTPSETPARSGKRFVLFHSPGWNLSLSDVAVFTPSRWPRVTHPVDQSLSSIGGFANRVTRDSQSSLLLEAVDEALWCSRLLKNCGGWAVLPCWLV
jgi:hypothetical protein